MPRLPVPPGFQLSALHARYDGPIPAADLIAAKQRPPRGSDDACIAAWAVVRYWALRASETHDDASHPLALGWLRVALAEWRQARRNAHASRDGRFPAVVYRADKPLY